jgi:hypothetical protein
VETAAAVAAVATRMRLEEELACHTQRLEEARAQLYTSGVPPPPAAAADAELCVMCFDAPKDHIILPCLPRVRVRGVCEPDEQAVVPHLPHRYPADQQGVPLVERPPSV